MNKILAIGFSALLIISCSTKSHKPENQGKEVETKEVRVLENQEQVYNGSNILVGEITVENFNKEPYNIWYDENYEYFKVDQAMIDEFKDALSKYDITIFMGTWCSDSQAVTPEFFKIMEAANYPEDKITMYAVDRSKKSLNGEEEGKNIDYVPTIIFYKDGKEVNRIVESPINTLEEDIRDIVLGKPYAPNYSE